MPSTTIQSIISPIDVDDDDDDNLSVTEEETREKISSCSFSPVHRALPFESTNTFTPSSHPTTMNMNMNMNIATQQWKERLHEWSSHEKIDDEDDVNNTNNKRHNKRNKNKSSGGQEGLTHLASYGMSEEQIIQLAHTKLPFFRSIRELKASGYEFRR